MFDSTCTECRTRYLIFPSQVTLLTNTDDGVVLDYVCWCGAEQAWHARGERRRLEAA